MKILQCKGGEFYAESACKNRAMCAKRWNSSVKWHQSIVSDTILIDVAARLAIMARAFSFPPDLPHSAPVLLNMKT